jgi:hypothetical protein
VNHEIIEHATRLLSHVPARCLSADVLYDRTRRDLGMTLPFDQYLEQLRLQPDRIAVLTCHFGDRAGWAAAERHTYDAAVSRAGLSLEPLVMLAATDPADDELKAPPRECTPEHELFSDIHAALAELLHAAVDDDALRIAAGGALAELDTALRRAALP